MSTGTIGGYDAAYPPGHPPAGDQAVMGYLGGDTPHAWTLADWNSQPARFRIGIWTRSNPQDAAQGTAEGKLAVAALRALGATPGSLHVLDYETAINAAYVLAFDAQIVAAGYKCALYGSTSTVFQNPRMSGGYFPADLTGKPHLVQGDLLTQYAFETAWDDDTVSAAAVLWDTRPAAPLPPPKETDMSTELYTITPTPAWLTDHAGTGRFTLSPVGITDVADENTWNNLVNKDHFPLSDINDSYAEALRASALKAQLAVPVSVNVDSSQLTASIVAAFSDPTLLAKIGTAIAHAEAVERHNDTPAS